MEWRGAGMKGSVTCCRKGKRGSCRFVGGLVEDGAEEGVEEVRRVWRRGGLS